MNVAPQKTPETSLGNNPQHTIVTTNIHAIKTLEDPRALSGNSYNMGKITGFNSSFLQIEASPKYKPQGQVLHVCVK